jgi:galactitol-specific phosphotransferase system IIB component
MVAPVAAAAGRVALTVGQRAWTYAAANAPAVAEKAKAYLATAGGGRPVEQMLASKSPATQGAIVKALLDSGMQARDFMEQAQLTADEARQYAQLVASYRVKQSASVDERQAPRVTSGDVFLDRVETNNQIREICTALGISSDMYAKIVRGVNMHTSKDIEVFQLDRKLRGERYL